MVTATQTTTEVTYTLVLSKDVAQTLHSVTQNIVGDSKHRDLMDEIFSALDNLGVAGLGIRFKQGTKISDSVELLGEEDE